MNVTDFTRNADVIAAIDDLRASCPDKVYSDILDNQGHQYVDIVMEGGGVLGIALVGYTYVLEQAGIRFLGIGGTSAGAINALLMAGLARPHEEKSVKVLKMVADLRLESLVDGDSDARDMCMAIAEKAGLAKKVWKAVQVVDSLFDNLGLNPGSVFEKWLATGLKAEGVKTLADLRRQMTPSGLRYRDGRPVPKSEYGAELAMVTAEVTTETKVVFPDMAALYWRDPEKVSPATFVRASMSIPGFFYPMRVRRIPKGDAARKLWRTKAGYSGKIPREVLFVDGGIMSNFPIDLFHSDKPPAAPTFGAKLGVDRAGPTEITRPTELLGAVFNAARHCADYDFLIRNKDYRKLVAFIQTTGFDWLDFFMPMKRKVALFTCGVVKAVEFLKGFNWGEYKLIRSNQLDR